MAGAICRTCPDSETQKWHHILEAAEGAKRGKQQQRSFVVMLFCVEPIREIPLLSTWVGSAGSHWSWAFVSPTENLAIKIYGDRPRHADERCFALRVEPGIPDANHVVSAILLDRQACLGQLIREAQQLHNEQFHGKKYNVLTRNCQDWALQHYAAIASKRSLPQFPFPLTGKMFAQRFAALFSLYWVAVAAVRVKRHRSLETPFLRTLFRDQTDIRAMQKDNPACLSEV